MVGFQRCGAEHARFAEDDEPAEHRGGHQQQHHDLNRQAGMQDQLQVVQSAGIGIGGNALAHGGEDLDG